MSTVLYQNVDSLYQNVGSKSIVDFTNDSTRFFVVVGRMRCRVNKPPLMLINHARYTGCQCALLKKMAESRACMRVCAIKEDGRVESMHESVRY